MGYRGHRLIGLVYSSGGPIGHVSKDGRPPPLSAFFLLSGATLANQVQTHDLFCLYFLFLDPAPLLVLGQDHVIFSEESTQGC